MNAIACQHRRESSWNTISIALFAIVALLAAICPIDLSAQVWQQVANNHWSVELVGAKTIVVVGEHGSILRSVDSGVHWTQVHSGTRRRLTRVRRSDSVSLTAVGDSGVVVRSTDTGKTWSQVSTPTNSNLRGLDFAENGVGVAVGQHGAVIRTMDAGATWTRVEAGVTAFLWDVQAFSARSIIVVGDSGIALKTSDAGVSWIRQSTGTTSLLRRVRFANPGFGVVAGDNRVLLVTQDSGQTWLARSGHEIGTVLSLAVSESGTILAGGVGINSQISRSTDSGASWISIGRFTPDHLLNLVRDLTFTDGQLRFAVGDPSLIAATRDRGENWTTLSHTPLRRAGSNELVGLYSAGFGSGDTGLIGGASNGGGTPYLRTSDRGTTWVSGELQSVTQIHGIHFFDADSAMAILESSGIYRSGDGGQSWFQDYNRIIVPRGSSLRSLQFADRYNGQMVGDSLVYRTTDGGHSWKGSVVPGTLYLTQVQFITKQLGFVASFGKVLRTRDGGATWEQIFSRPTNRGNAIWFLDSMVGFTTGAVGFLHRTFDAGATWDSLDIGARVFLDDILFLNDRVGYIVGDPGAFLLKTTDAGRNWFREQPWPEDPSDRIIELYHLYALPDRRTLLAFGNGVILRGSFDEPFSSVEDLQTTNRTESVRLHIQPNPATRTEVTVDVKLGLDVVFDPPPRIVVFDLLGRIVSAQPIQLRQLLDKRSYRAIVDASELYPGMYFVRFEVGSTTATESLVIVPGD